MSWSCNTDGFPAKLNSYDEARKFFDSKSPFPSAYGRPIGSRRCTNKAMFLRNACEDIVFKFYHTKCVIWHADNSVTVRGYDTNSTTSFVDALTPNGVGHGKGRSDDYEPVLHLQCVDGRPEYPQIPYYDPGYREEHDRWLAQMKAFWASGSIVKCGYGVTLNYNADARMWLPDEADVTPFKVPRIDRKLAREIAKRFRLKDFETMVPAAVALKGIRQQNGNIYHITNALERGDFAKAMESVGVGTMTRSSYGRSFGGPSQIDPGFFRKLRDHVYSSNGAVNFEEVRMLSPNSYRTYLQDSRRFV
jgi:hypothetical protein